MNARLLHELRLFLIALQFLTRLPMPRWVGFEPDWLQASARHFPAVGAIVGVAAGAVLALASSAFPSPVAVVLSMLASVLLTGAFHEDGLADTVDALGGAVGRERALEIMKDSRIGTYGAVALWMALGLKAAVLCALPLSVAVPALVLGHTISRAAAVVLMRWLPYAGDLEHAKAKPLATRISARGLGVALGWAVAMGAGLALTGTLPLVLMTTMGAAAGVAALLCARWWRRRLAGITGDTLGATQQIAELFALLCALAALRLTTGAAG